MEVIVSLKKIDKIYKEELDFLYKIKLMLKLQKKMQHQVEKPKRVAEERKEKMLKIKIFLILTSISQIL